MNVTFFKRTEKNETFFLVRLGCQKVKAVKNSKRTEKECNVLKKNGKE